jgi:hypothetical protein
MLRKALVAVAVVGLFAPGACSLKKRAPGTCIENNECEPPQVCRMTPPYQYQCVTEDGGVPGCSDTNLCADGGACEPTTNTCVQCVKNANCHGAKGACDPATHTCVACLNGDDCNGDKGACDTATHTCVGCVNSDDCDGDKKICEMTAQTCVQCLENKHCTLATTPICDGKTCRACKADSECVETGVCLEDGRCAGATEIAYVEFHNDSTCPNPAANGSATTPYCTLADAVTALSADRPVLVVRGPAGDRLSINRPALSAVVIGKNNGAGAAASITAGPSTGVQVVAGDILVRDLAVSGGAAGGRGLLVSGAAAKLRLLRVTASLGTGLGIQADTGAELHMDRCLVAGNSVGGMLINGATYDIQNTIVGNNGYGIKFSAAAIPGASQFRFNTVAGNTGNATTCDSTNARDLTASIIVGTNDSCTPDNTVLSTTSLSSTFHLTAPVSCPNTPPASPPDHDFDGDPRMSPFDCGADQHTQ